MLRLSLPVPQTLAADGSSMKPTLKASMTREARESILAALGSYCLIKPRSHSGAALLLNLTQGE
jgi:hypothetical protein